MKTCFKVLLPLLLSLTLPTALEAQFTYITNNGAITITGYTGPSGALSIPDTIDGLPVTTIGTNAFYNSSSLTSVTMGTNVTSLGPGAFKYCANLTSVTLGINLTSIGRDAFLSCSRLTSLTIPDGVTTVGLQAFMQCTSLTNATLGNGVTSIADLAFYNCTSLASVTIGNSVTNIGFWSFYYCSRLTSLTIPSSVTGIRQYSFEYCTSLNGVFFQGNAPSADTTVFSYDSYATVYYVAGTTNWASTFAGRPAFLWDPQVPYSYSTNNGAISITGDISGYTNSGSPVVMTIPAMINGLPVTSIGPSAFQYHTNLTTVNLPNSITNIGNFAFFNCSSLKSITIPTSVTGIESWAFGFCYILEGAYFQGNAPSADTTPFISDTSATVYYLPGTTNWGATFGGRPTALWRPKVQTSDGSFGLRTTQFGFNISWASGRVVVVEVCTNLASHTWSPVGTNTLTSGSAYFSDPEWTNYPARFYRLRSP